MRMTRFDLIKRFSAENDPDWPERNLQAIFYSNDEVNRVLCSFDFNFDSWLNYKLQVSTTSSSEHVFRYPRLSSLLTFEEYCSYAQTELSQDDTHYSWYHFFSPTVTPQLWRENLITDGAFSQRVWWLTDQWNWIQEGFPAPPDVIWHSKRHLRPILYKLVYYPYITTWEVPSFDFCLKLSNALEASEYWWVLHTFIWAFQDLGKEFPSPSVYCLYRSQWKEAPFSVLDDSMSLSPDFWLWLEQEIKEISSH